MSTTKERIISTALRVFNENGVTKTTTRKIAEEMEITHGNLTYHYLKKSQIIEVLYEQMFAEMEAHMQPLAKTSLQFLQNTLQFYYQFQYRYRFFFLDIVEITRLYPTIAQRHLVTQQKREQEACQLLDLLVQEGLLIPPKTDQDHRHLAHLIWFINNFWMGQQWVFGQKPSPKDAQATSRMIWQLLMPYFTEKAWKEYTILEKNYSQKP